MLFYSSSKAKLLVSNIPAHSPHWGVEYETATILIFLLKDHLLSNFTDAVASIKKQTDQTYVNKLIVTNGLKVKK